MSWLFDLHKTQPVAHAVGEIVPVSMAGFDPASSRRISSGEPCGPHSLLS